MSNIAIRITAAKELYAEATPPPWKAVKCFTPDCWCKVIEPEVVSSGCVRSVDSESIAALHNLFPNLVANWERKSQQVNDYIHEQVDDQSYLQELVSENVPSADPYGDRNGVPCIQDLADMLVAKLERLQQRVAELEKGIRDYIERENAFGERR